ncbi:MAG: tetratricopeptide repeat protein [Planctomycetes bacterium]|nr:tetratricopeptide repeat protein [Planctomycetota bacterium]
MTRRRAAPAASAPPAAAGAGGAGGADPAAWWSGHDVALAVGCAWLLLVLLPVSNLLFEGPIVQAERLLYLPSVGSCLALGSACMAVARAARPALAARAPVLGSVLRALGPLLLVLFGLLTALRGLEWRDTDAFYAALLARDADHPTARCAWSELLLAQGRVDEAEEQARLAVQYTPGYGPALVALAEVRAARGDPAGAVELLGRALDAAPPDLRPGFLVRRAELLLFAGHPAAARREVAALLALVPDHPAGRELQAACDRAEGR